MEREGAESKAETKSVDGGGGGGEKETKNKKKRVAHVGAALTCLPSVDAGGPGPRVESWAFALSRKGLALAAEAGVFGSHGCKLCADGVVVAGEKERRGKEERRREKKRERRERIERSQRRRPKKKLTKKLKKT